MDREVLLRPLKIGLLNVVAGFLYESLPTEVKLNLWQLAPPWWQSIDHFVIGMLSCIMGAFLGAYGKPFLVDII